ncbi:MAG TPA: AI-2E family transporter [Candidatus Limnocylindria bacterium]|jgi:predicted PurR-regulated permease PerM|nr:AI-2E family transporter [Candidatus Limnocylindria bacterium]
MDFPGPTRKQAHIIWFALTTLAVTLTLIIIGAVLWGLGQLLNLLSPVLLPLAVAAVLAYLLDPVVDWLVKRRIRRGRAISGVFALTLVLVVAVLSSIIPRVVIESRELAGRIPSYAQRLQGRVEHWLDNPPAPLVRFLPLAWQQRLDPARSGLPAEGTSVPPPETPPKPIPADAPWWLKALDPATIKSAGGWLGAVLPAIGEWLFGQASKVATWFGLLVGLMLVPVYTFYFLLEKRGIEEQWTNYLPVQNSRFKDEMVFVLTNINECLIVFFRGQVLVALCDGALYTVGFLCIGMPYAMLLGLMATLLTMIPFLGAITTCATSLVIALVQFGDWTHIFLVLGVFGIVQAMEALVFQPKIIGNRVGLHPMIIIVGLMVGTTLLGGILGGILAIPLTAALRVLMVRYVWKRK